MPLHIPAEVRLLLLLCVAEGPTAELCQCAGPGGAAAAVPAVHAAAAR